jgi:hypothetical protein
MEEEKIDFESLSNNELLFKLKQYEADFEAIKLRMIQDNDKLDKIEKDYEEINRIILKRLKKEI